MIPFGTPPRIFVIIIICIAAPNWAFGQVKEPHDRLLEFFAGTCLHNMPDIERIKASARALNWKPLEGDLAAMLAPADKRATWQGWAAKVGKDIFMAGVSEGNVDGRKIVTCTVTTREVNQNKLTQTLNEELDLKAVSDESELLQRYRAWQIKINDEIMLLNLTTLLKEMISPATLSVLVWN